MTSPPRPSRRRWLLRAGGALTAGFAATGLYAWRVEPHWLHAVHRDLPIRGLPDDLEGRTLVQLSDLHVGPVVDSDYLTAALKWVSDVIRPDLTVVTGDFMQCEAAEQVDEAARVLKHLKPGPLGCLAVLGNHDYGLGWSDVDAASRLVVRLGDLGITVLRNAARTVAGLQVVGIDDLWGPFFPTGPLRDRFDWSVPSLVLCHNPDAVDLPIWHDFRGWVLSGHTHGGQCKPPFLPPPMLPVKNLRYTQGAFDLAPDRALYINPGLGYLKRVRFNVRPEVTVFRLMRGRSESSKLAAAYRLGNANRGGPGDA